MLFPDQLRGRVMPLHHRSRVRISGCAEDVAPPRRSSSMRNHRLFVDSRRAIPRQWPWWTVVLVARLVERSGWNSRDGRGYAGLGGRGDYSSMYRRHRWGGLVVEGSCEVIIDRPI